MKGLYRPVDFKKGPCHMSLRPKNGCVAQSILGVYYPRANQGGLDGGGGPNPMFNFKNSPATSLCRSEMKMSPVDVHVACHYDL